MSIVYNCLIPEDRSDRDDPERAVQDQECPLTKPVLPFKCEQVNQNQQSELYLLGDFPIPQKTILLFSHNKPHPIHPS